jgi:hypothetical protein
MQTARVIGTHHHTAVFHDQHRIVSTDRPDVGAHQHANRLSGSIVPVARSGLLNVPSAALAIGRDVRSRQPDIRDPRHGESPHVAWQRVCGLDGGQEGEWVIGSASRPGRTLCPRRSS